jgi:glutaredoxin
MIHIYVLDGCPYCEAAIAELEKQKIPFISYVVTGNLKNKLKKEHKMDTFPQIFADIEKLKTIKKGKTKSRKTKATVPIKKIIKEVNLLKLGGHSDLQNIIQICMYLKQNPKVVSVIQKFCE